MLSLRDLKKDVWYDPKSGLFIRIRSSNGAPVGAFIGTRENDGYISINVRNKTYRAHRLAWFYENGEWPRSHLDHINRVKSDNRLSNLRECSVSQNHANRKCMANSSTGIKGVSKTRNGKFRARIRIFGSKESLGTFDTSEEAHKAYMEKLREIHGEFASS